MQVKNPIEGAMTALVTPFKNGVLDLETYASLIKRQICNGIDALIPVGTTGESATLSHKEHKECIEVAVSVCRDSNIKVLAGAGSNSTQEAIELAKFAQSCGADAILCVTPYYNKPTQEGLFQHYKAVANAVEIPLMLYNVPSRTGVSLESATILRLFEEVSNVYGIKEASGSIEKVIDLNAQAEDLCIVSGEDVINYPILSCGGRGVISVTSNLLPNKIAELTHALLKEQNYTLAKQINNGLYAINKALFIESNPIPIKAAMYLSGLLKTLEYRLPLVEPNLKNMQFLEEILKQYEVV
ncbi:4-hydroxy-tetrahydrodipicolinate synthase [Helicobacter sp.]|uniref:4-hydroxy-tetrahydrodipicolinate synthase n=1 Tax=Helicobacter sp. TaxID=218 RepID=UPI0025B7FD96|nr:4-hydroxy-tetrahydrodipicolinate synthase [Helicobacter sp.]MCI5969284.1 4-hydroxy-tetrahydrodipicolinate synthase [Helicobacter sp.]MDY2585538.1 4-hydroxy-tetrahydrodipicolinate synthase [Helicobacter sp.]